MDYSVLSNVLTEALADASAGKGKIRHANNEESYEDQPIFWIEKHFKSFQLGQAVKKIHESQRLNLYDAAEELLGAINYLAARIIYLRSLENATETNEKKYPDLQLGRANRMDDSHYGAKAAKIVGSLQRKAAKGKSKSKR